MARARDRLPSSTAQLGARGVRLAVALLVALSVFAPLVQAEDEGPADKTRLVTVRAAVKGLGETLKEQLLAAIKAGGPVSAIVVCRTIAPAISEEKSRTYGLEVGRTALKVRNPVNAPDAFERKVLEEFVRKIETGADPASLEHAETVTEGGEKLFRYMKAIPAAAEPCLACHGSNLQPEIKAEILRLYPPTRRRASWRETSGTPSPLPRNWNDPLAGRCPRRLPGKAMELRAYASRSYSTIERPMERLRCEPP